MSTLFKEVSYSLQTLIQNIDMGIIGLFSLKIGKRCNILIF